MEGSAQRSPGNPEDFQPVVVGLAAEGGSAAEAEGGSDVPTNEDMQLVTERVHRVSQLESGLRALLGGGGEGGGSSGAGGARAGRAGGGGDRGVGARIDWNAMRALPRISARAEDPMAIQEDVDMLLARKESKVLEYRAEAAEMTAFYREQYQQLLKSADLFVTSFNSKVDKIAMALTDLNLRHSWLNWLSLNKARPGEPFPVYRQKVVAERDKGARGGPGEGESGKAPGDDVGEAEGAGSDAGSDDDGGGSGFRVPRPRGRRGARCAASESSDDEESDESDEDEDDASDEGREAEEGGQGGGGGVGGEAGGSHEVGDKEARPRQLPLEEALEVLEKGEDVEGLAVAEMSSATGFSSKWEGQDDVSSVGG